MSTQGWGLKGPRERRSITSYLLLSGLNPFQQRRTPIGGWRGIRTPTTLSGLTVFKTAGATQILST